MKPTAALVAQRAQKDWLGSSARLIALAPALIALSACATFPKFETRAAVRDATSEGTATTGRTLRPRVESLSERATKPQPDAAAKTVAAASPRPETAPIAATSEQIAALLSERSVQASLPPQPLPQFIDTVFGQILKVPYYTGPGVAARREIVSLRGSVSTSNRAFFAMVQTALRDYGLVVAIEGGAVRVLEDPNLAAQTPLFIRTRALPDTPEPSRPVIQFFELRALDVRSVMGLLSETYPNRGKVRFSPREDINTLVISGNARDVAAAAAVVDQIDKPRFADGQIARVEPVFWSAERLTQAVVEAMRTEGYTVGLGLEETKNPLVFLPLPFSNDILLFSNRQDVYERALSWIERLDKPAAFGDQEGVFVYQVKNTTAAELGALIAQTAPEGGTSANRRATIQRPNAPSQAAPATPTAGGGKVTVDAGGNRLLFRGTPSEFERARAVMEELDTPPQQVLVELTIAEVTLTDETRFGVEWFLQQRSSGDTLTVNTRGGSTRDAGGLGVTLSRAFSRGTVDAALNAFAQNQNLNILSTPRLVARSGSDAQILIGTDIPIITSQRAADNQTGGNTDILQTVQYRQTGVILNMKPVVFGDDGVEIDLYQEVSSQSANRVAGISSPLILNRSVSTKLTLREGTTAVIGGLMQDSYSRDQTGIPVLKDVPVVGQAFRSDDVSGNKVELLILITPYIIRNEDQMADAAATYTDSLNALLRKRGPHGYTLLPWRSPLAKAKIHGAGDPRVDRASPSSSAMEPTSPAPAPTTTP